MTYFNDDTVNLIRDLTHQVAYYRSLLETFERDALTGYYRREKFVEYTKAVSDKALIAVVFFDINGLKDTNDNAGHHVGDALIQKAAQSLSLFHTERSEVFRIGGDEFSVVLWDCTSAELDALIAAWRERLANLNRAGGIICEMACGAASTETDGSGMSVSDLMRKADERMYAEKRLMKEKTGSGGVS